MLAGLVLLDLSLMIWAFFLPQLWFEVWHGASYDDPAALLRRCGASWGAFALIQAIALGRWRREPTWLAVVAGVRLSDVFTDLTTAAVARELTWAGAVLLPSSSLANLVLGIGLLWTHRRWSAAPGGARRDA